ncbi:hypothetical protein BJF79_11830 [Actinomadura sp. CNU-125]|uniref:hypothetical protein n=1 Tax=Actinomadura sp. CNU-125 TaxID=1904961 RepID=UPI0009634494|nr:hypothetical protein [Actinomadura sp. CNU-125]OLT26923.1 hypothetical protein BJF79_11830 [Actinomadura sp. CNU-125]
MDTNDWIALISQGRAFPCVPARIGRHDVLLEEGGRGTTVYRVRGDRVLAIRANRAYREDVAAALLDAVDGLADRDDLGAIVRLRPIDVPGFALDRAALFGAGHAPFFRGRPLEDRGMEVVPVHRTEAADGTDAHRFLWGTLTKSRCYWDREPEARADVRRLDDGAADLFFRVNPKRPRPTVFSAPDILARIAWAKAWARPVMPDGVRLSIEDVRRHELRVHRVYDRLRGTLHVPGEERIVEFDLPLRSVEEAFGPLFAGADFDPDAFAAVAARPAEEMLEMVPSNPYTDDGRGNHGIYTLSECLARLRHEYEDGDHLTYIGRSRGSIRIAWRADGGSGETRLRLEVPGSDGGRFVSLDEADEALTVLALEDRVADGL